MENGEVHRDRMSSVVSGLGERKLGEGYWMGAELSHLRDKAFGNRGCGCSTLDGGNGTESHTLKQAILT